MILTNEHRHYLGLSLIALNWDIVPFNEEKNAGFSRQYYPKSHH